MSKWSFIQPGRSFPVSSSPNYSDLYKRWIEIEEELWVLFPETQGRRVAVHQFGQTGYLLTCSGACHNSENCGRVKICDNGTELENLETYMLMPCCDNSIRPLRMKPLRRLTLEEWRMANVSATKLAELLDQEMYHEYMGIAIGVAGTSIEVADLDDDLQSKLGIGDF